MTPRQFVEVWQKHALTERQFAHSHFLDICKLVEHDPPAKFDPTGEVFAFERGASKISGGEGWADVWKKNHFAWEYKKKRRDLDAAMKQLADYSAALDNPPIHVACDSARFRIQTRFTNTITKT